METEEQLEPRQALRDPLLSPASLHATLCSMAMARFIKKHLRVKFVVPTYHLLYVLYFLLPLSIEGIDLTPLGRKEVIFCFD